MTRNRPPLNRPLPYLTRNPLLYWLVLSLLAVLFGFGLQAWLTGHGNGNMIAGWQLDCSHNAAS